MDEVQGLMDLEKLERQFAMMLEGERPQGWPTDPRGDYFWESQVLTNLLQEYEDLPDEQAYFKTKLDELKERGYDAPVPTPTAEPPSVMRGR